jgi:cytochrome b subunit of formate dehydrogenase
MLLVAAGVRAQDEVLEEDNKCIECHGTEEIWDAQTRHLYVTSELLSADIHWQKGIRCQDCHGGNASTTDLRSAHAVEDGFRKINTPADMPAFCGYCHSNAEYMHRFRPDAPVDLIARYWASVHGVDLAQRKWPAPVAAGSTPDTPEDADAPETEGTGADDAEPGVVQPEPADTQPSADETTSDQTLDETPEEEAADTGDAEEAAADTGDAEEEVSADVVPDGASGDQLMPGNPPIPAATCTSCHPVHQMLAVADPRSAVSNRRLAETCGACHREALVNLRRSVHAKAGERNETGAGTLLDCSKCHGRDVHDMLPITHPASPVFLDHQVKICGECHKAYLETYLQSAHGTGLVKSGLLVTAACADCHGAHDIFYAADTRSSLHSSNVSARCGTCHHFLAERLAQSVHGSGAGAAPIEHLAPGGTSSRKPGCTDCHQGHDPVRPRTPEFRAELPNRCGNCHQNLADRYRLSLHGELTEFGYVPAAECADCHGAHDIRPLSDPDSRLAGGNRLQTCRQCHANAVAKFATYDPHASYKDGQGYPFLHGIYHWLERIVYVLVGLFVLHMFCWFTRSFFFARRFGRDRPCVAGGKAIVAFEPLNRLVYALLLVSFIGLVLTGLPLKYGAYPWAKRVAGLVGGFGTTSVWHHVFAVVLLAACGSHLVRACRAVWAQRREGTGWQALLRSPDGPVPGRRDLRDMGRMAVWFVGLGRKPKFERWTYWEKFDYWAVYAALGVIALPGLMLWFPNFFCLFLPGTVLNVAKVVHSEVALMAAGFVFMIHVFNTHLRPEKFPLDVSWFTGVVSESHMIKSRPDYLRRLQAEGKLEALRTWAPDRPRLRRINLQAVCLLGAGLCVLVVVVLVSLSK